jgi:hypothetical protein
VPESTNIFRFACLKARTSIRTQRYAMVKQNVRLDALNDSSPNDSYRTAGLMPLTAIAPRVSATRC